MKVSQLFGTLKEDANKRTLSVGNELINPSICLGGAKFLSNCYYLSKYIYRYQRFENILESEI